MAFLVGTSGWQYRDWRGSFYPPGAPTASWLGLYADRFPVLEVNSTFYRLPDRSTFEHWEDVLRDRPLRVVLKASRYLTHVRRLADPAEPVAHLLERAAPIAHRLTAVLVQLPPGFRIDASRLDATLAAFDRYRVRVAFEPRDPSWFADEALAVLRDHDTALCWTDRRGRVGPLTRTAPWGYLRLHEGLAGEGSYGARALTTWAGRLDQLWPDRDDEVLVMFNNDHAAAAPRNAAWLARLLRARGRDAPGPDPPAW